MVFQAFLLCSVLCVGLVYGQTSAPPNFNYQPSAQYYASEICYVTNGASSIPTRYNTRTQRCHFNKPTNTWSILATGVSQSGGLWPYGSCSLNNKFNPKPSVSSTVYNKKDVNAWWDCCSDLLVNNIVYDRFEQFCCDGRRNGVKIANAQVFDIGYNGQSGCCGNQFFNPASQLCCQGNISAWSDDHECCGGSLMPTDGTKFCCNGTQYTVPPANANYYVVDSCAWGQRVYDKTCHVLLAPAVLGSLYHDQSDWGSGALNFAPVSGRPTFCNSAPAP